MKKLDIFLLVYKIILLILVVAVLAWGCYSIIDAAQDAYLANGEDFLTSFGSELTTVVTTILIVIADAALVLLSLPGLLVSIFYKTNLARKRDIIHFVCLTLLPAVSFCIYYFITTVGVNILFG